MRSRFCGIWVFSLLAGAVTIPGSAPAQSIPKESPPQRPPKPIEPPHKAVQQGFRLTATIGLNLLANGKYQYNTTVIMPDGRAFDYNGVQRSSGGMLSLGAAATPGGALRRLTMGFDLNFGGLETWAHPVIPSGSVTPFSQSNLNSQVAQQSLASPPRRPFVSPYIEHELASVLQNRVRLGYQYLHTAKSYGGSFAADQSGSIQANYNVRFSQTSHMIRVAVHNDTWLDDTDRGHVPPKRRFGFVQQAGVLIGTDRSVIVFVRTGPVWIF
jgi:hypothetical protein